MEGISPALTDFLARTGISSLVPVHKRGPYQHHKDRLDRLERLFSALSRTDIELPRGAITELSTLLAVRRTTLCDWRKRLRRQPMWRPSRRAYADVKRMFTDAEEEELVRRIKANSLDRDLFYCDEDFKIDALAFAAELREQLEDGETLSPAGAGRIGRLAGFKCTAPFISAFRARHCLSLRRPRLKRRTKASEEEIKAFVERLADLMARHPLERIVNVDETARKAVAPGFLTWANKNSESVRCYIENSEKEAATVIAAITAAGDKLPLTVIWRGKTPRCLASFDLPVACWATTSPSGWTTTEVMITYLRMLRERRYPEGPLIVVLDTYPAHRSAAVKQAAEELGVELVFVPPGCTDRVQPLDRRVFGALKAHARLLWRRQYHATAGDKVTRRLMAANLVEAWDTISAELVEEAWLMGQPDWGDQTDEVPEHELQEFLRDPDYVPDYVPDGRRDEYGDLL